jgi:phosphoribosyl-ATP pyrophosphohydrolase / phosphoribosyl-AMP cyclohydrolase / histidinol dehydrogenase
MAVFFPLLAQDVQDDLKLALERIAPLIISPEAAQRDPDLRQFFVLADADAQFHQVTQWLNDGALKTILPPSLISKFSNSGIPSSRLILLLDMVGGAALSDTLRDTVSGVFIKSHTIDSEAISSVKRFFPGADLYVLPQQANTQEAIRDLQRIGATLVVPSEKLTLGTSSDTCTNVGDAFLAPITSDRPDGLFPTVVTSYANSRNLGLVYSSRESVRESIVTGKGVYQSRKHGLWRKGETSGATQQVVSIQSDCDNDALEFNVIQVEPGFCHLNQPSCFGELAGLAKLERTLISRLASAPPESYTHRLFNDSDLLQKKIREEADELCAANTKDEIAFETADLLYFALVKCIKNGVSLADVEACLDKKAQIITRRPGNPKPQYSNPPDSATTASVSPPAPTTNGTANGIKPLTNGTSGHLPKTAAPKPSVPAPPAINASNDRIRMRSVNISGISAKERAALLQRPVLKSDDMIAKVTPIVNLVRTKGDAALRELTSKLDKVTLSDVLIRPPFFVPEAAHCRDGASVVQLNAAVREAIDKAYGNISRFHKAQATETLVVETVPGVVCQRFTKAISRVGLYVPGGTAILPSTALMLGIPAQVAGCREVVIATPPCPDGTVSPEVLYVAHLVGATAILKAGGAQAIGAMAYGTESVPKVDKIFGPGNQWVTAAKMMVQNDSDAMVAIDMPAGPSEVLVGYLVV